MTACQLMLITGKQLEGLEDFSCNKAAFLVMLGLLFRYLLKLSYGENKNELLQCGCPHSKVQIILFWVHT